MGDEPAHPSRLTLRFSTPLMMGPYPLWFILSMNLFRSFGADMFRIRAAHLIHWSRVYKVCMYVPTYILLRYLVPLSGGFLICLSSLLKHRNPTRPLGRCQAQVRKQTGLSNPHNIQTCREFRHTSRTPRLAESSISVSNRISGPQDIGTPASEQQGSHPHDLSS